MADPTELEIRIAGPRAEAERIGALLERAQQGDASVVLELRKALDQQPHLWRAVGDLARTAESAWIQRATASNLFFRESITRRVRELRRELQGEAPTPLARLLVDRVIVTWIGLHYCEAVHARTMHEQTFAQGEYYQERVVRYQKLHLAAIKALATLRRLEQRVSGAVVQVNVAERQVNVATTAPGPAPAAPEEATTERAALRA